MWDLATIETYCYRPSVKDGGGGKSTTLRGLILFGHKSKLT